jgi:hypothetical protein
MVVDGGVTAGSTIMERPNYGGSPYGDNAYAGPSFTVGKG